MVEDMAAEMVTVMVVTVGDRAAAVTGAEEAVAAL